MMKALQVTVFVKHALVAQRRNGWQLFRGKRVERLRVNFYQWQCMLMCGKKSMIISEMIGSLADLLYEYVDDH